MGRYVRRILGTALSAIFLLSAFSYPMCAVGENDKIVIMLDPGHGGGSIGTAAGDVGEKVMTLRLASLIRDRLAANGSFAVYMTRTGDTDLSLAQRAILADGVNADLLVSIHFDGSTNAADNGVTAYTSVFEEWALVELGNDICVGLSGATGLSSNGVKQKHDTQGYYWNSTFQWDAQDKSLGVLSDYYGIPTWCAKFGIPSLIIEHGFFTNGRDQSVIFADGTLERMADAEAQAIIAYYTNHTHTYGAKTQDYPSNCIFQGKTSLHCTRCGHRKGTETLPAAPDRHYWQVTDSASAACGVDGYTQYTCRITSNLSEKGYSCEIHTWRDVIPAPTEHSYARVEYVPAGHGCDGYSVYRCSTCASSFREEEKGEAHSWEYITYVEPACTEGGGDLYRCTVCGGEYTDGVPALGHTFDPEAHVDIPADCETAGYRKDVCITCAYVEETHTDALGHDFGGEETVTPAACEEDGRIGGYCLRCEKEIEEILPAVGHSYTETIESPTCTEDGVRTQSCTVCGDKRQEKFSAYGHLWNAGTVVQKPGIFRSGKEVHICRNGCGETMEIQLPPWIITDGVWYVAAAAVCAWIAALLLYLYFRRKGKRLDELPLFHKTAL